MGVASSILGRAGLLIAASAAVFAVQQQQQQQAAGPLLSRADGEHVVLADCKDGQGVVSSQMAYFPSSPGSSPQDVAVIQTASPGEAALWVSTTTKGLFTDTGVSFTAFLGPKVSDGQFAGTGSNGYGSFSCWQKYQLSLYKYGNTTCSMVYDCNHEAAPTTSVPAASSSSPYPSAATSSAVLTTSMPPTTSSNTETTAAAAGLATGAVAGIAVGASFAVFAALAGAFLAWRQQCHRHRARDQHRPAELPGEVGEEEPKDGGSNDSSGSSGSISGMFKKGPPPYPASPPRATTTTTTMATEQKQPTQNAYEMDAQWQGVHEVQGS